MKLYRYRIKLVKKVKIRGRLTNYMIVNFSDNYIEQIFKQYNIPFERIN